jgi:hypothetical protein
MSILDDAIREHLELKRAHGADEGELKRLEDEAFGPPQRPDEVDPFAEAPTEFLTAPTEAAADAPEIGDEGERSGRRPNLTDLQEPPPPADAPGPPPAASAQEPPPPPAGEVPVDRAPPTAEAPADLAPPAGEAPPRPPQEAPAPPAEEEHPAGEHEVVADAGPDTQERHAIADQPTQMFDVQAEMDAEGATAPPGEQESPTDEELVDAVQEEPRAAPPAGSEPEEDSAEFDFFNEQRLSDELDQALEAPLPPTDEHIAMPRYEDAPAQGGVFDFESDEEPYEDDPSQEVLRRAEEAEEATAAEEPPSEETPRDSAEQPAEEDETDYDPETGHEDVLEDTPRFLEDQPEDDDLWFEQKPPKDFDLD